MKLALKTRSAFHLTLGVETEFANASLILSEIQSTYAFIAQLQKVIFCFYWYAQGYLLRVIFFSSHIIIKFRFVASTLGPAKITVQVHSKNITLPLNTATLTAYSIPDAPEDYPYSYEWSLIDDENKDNGQEAGRSGVMESKSEQQLKLSKLEEGTYKFKVTVVRYSHTHKK